MIRRGAADAGHRGIVIGFRRDLGKKCSGDFNQTTYLQNKLLARGQLYRPGRVGDLKCESERSGLCG